MSNISELSKSAKKTRSTPQKQTDLKNADLELVAQRLSLILGHIQQMPKNTCISGVKMTDGFLLVALKVKGSELDFRDGTLYLDGKDVATY